MRLFSIVAATLAVVGLSLLSTSVLAAPTAKPVEWKVGGKTFSGFLVYDYAEREQRPGLLMVPDWMGVTDDAVAKAKQVAGDDYVVLVVDMYGKGVRPKDADEAMAQVKLLYADREAMRARTQGALATLKSQAGKAPLDAARIAAFGYCFGGSSVLELARSGADFKGAITFHGGLDTTAPAKAGGVKAPILVLNGADDRGTAPHIAAFEKEMNEADADWQFVNFSGAVHCFALENANRPPGCVYNARAAKRAYKMMDDFLDEVFAR
ncbi:dienelactone hydrolase family protein [Pseudoxanthomonas indica]|uniref:Dienelactone hydrolase n=1 Tax=Pseudoxanthomonas indica TaxID=428993 RepID=A0A1T5LLW3_9GAMM|nr:dienelactone hydrolase family protein [Pseudoxanthomonas indica]GGD36768.1 DeoR family transcriptional regulator [Pseudoxanthomonas indica]SKC76956.1 Dienelactone hydrolase [Pseudoxanthomonas indica]